MIKSSFIFHISFVLEAATPNASLVVRALYHLETTYTYCPAQQPPLSSLSYAISPKQFGIYFTIK